METIELEHFFSSRWTATIEKCERSLEEDDLDQIHSLTSWDAVRRQLDGPVPHQVALLKPSLGHLNAFANFFQTKLGPELDATFLWGTIGMLLQLTAHDDRAVDKVPYMMKALIYKAEAFNGLVAIVKNVTNQMKEACFDIQVKLVEFLADAIKSIRDEIGVSRYASRDGQDTAWLLLEQRYLDTNAELKETIERIRNLALIGTATAAQAHSSSPTPAVERNFRCLVLPQTKVPRFFNRTQIFSQIEEALDRRAEGKSFRSVALYGLGGVGKSSIVARYVESQLEGKDESQKEGQYDCMFWIHGEKTTSIRQSFTDIAMKLKLSGAKPQDHDDNLNRVQDWLQSTDQNWLLIYDNVESAELLRPYWPAASHGTAIITTRNHTLALDPAGFGIEIKSWDPETGSEFLLFLLRRSIGNDLTTEQHSALDLSKRLSGHALALAHMAGLIHRRSWSIAEFMNVYLKNPRRQHETDLQALWEFSFKSLNRDSFTCLGIMSYLMPDRIPQALFEIATDDDLPENLEFLRDEFSFYEAIDALLTLALIQRNRDTRTYSIHRMVQTQFKYILNAEQSQRCFDDAVSLVYNVFPKADETGAQLYEQWAVCNEYLQHVIQLKDCFKEGKTPQLQATWKFCTLLKDCQRFLYESNLLTELEDFNEVNLAASATLADGDQNADLKASILSHQANFYESIGSPKKAIELNLEAYDIRLHERQLKPGLLACFENNLGYNYNTANDHETSLEWFIKARDRWLALSASKGNQLGWPTYAKTNTARCLFYLNRLAEARELNDVSIAEFKATKPLNWAMLAYAYFVSGRLDRFEGKPDSAEAHFTEAQNVWIKGDQKQLHPFYGSCAYKIGACSLDQGKVEAAIKHLRDAVRLTEAHRRMMPVEYARAVFKLSEALVQDDLDSEAEAIALREEAETHLKNRKPDAVSFGTEAAYDCFIPVFWR